MVVWRFRRVLERYTGSFSLFQAPLLWQDAVRADGSEARVDNASFGVDIAADEGFFGFLGNGDVHKRDFGCPRLLISADLDKLHSGHEKGLVMGCMVRSHNLM